MEKFLALPIVLPLVSLLRSRKFWVAVATLVVNMLVAQYPQLKEVSGELMNIITFVGISLIAGIAAEDIAKTKAAG